MDMAKIASPLKRIIELINLDRKEIVSIYFFAISSGLVQLSLPLGVQAIISFVLGATMVTSIYILIFVVVLGVILVGVFQINQMKIIEKIQQNIFVRNSFQIAENLPQIDLYSNNEYYLPEKVTRYFDIMSVQKGISKILLDIPLASIQIIFGLLLLSFYHPVFIIFGLLLLIILILILRITGKKGVDTSYMVSNQKYKVSAWFIEIARTIKSFKFRNGTGLNMHQTDNKVNDYLGARTNHFKVLLLQFKTLVIFKVLITLTMLTVGTYLLLDQQLNIGEFIAAEIVILSIIGAVEKLIGSLPNVYDVIIGLEKIASVTESKKEKSGKIEFLGKTQGVQLAVKDCSFQYPNGKRVFKNISFDIPKGAKVAVTGIEGSGKSTLLNLISGNYSKYEGEILVNTIELSNYDFCSFRKRVGFYLSLNDVFKGTLFDNIAMGRKSVTPDKIIEIANLMGLDHILKMLNNGLETVIDPAGLNVSSTLVKTIVLIRAFVDSPDLLLLEDPWGGFNQSIKDKLINYILNLNTTVIVATNSSDFLEKSNIRLQISEGIVNLNKLN